MATPSKIKFPAKFTAVEDLLLWHNVPKSAAVLVTATALYVLLEWSGLPLLTWLSNLTMVLVLGCMLWALIARFMGSTGPAEHLPAVLRTGLDEVAVRDLAEKTRVAVNDLLGLVRRILSGYDFVLIFKTLGVLYATSMIGRVITPVGLLYTVILGLFSIPKVYEML